MTRPTDGRGVLYPPPMDTEPFGIEAVSRFEETKRIRRVIDLVQLVAGQPRRWLRRDLAARYEVSERQIDKDLELIRHGLVLDLRHDASGYRFERLPNLAAAPLTFEQALALLLAAQMARANSGVDSAELQSAVNRLEAQLPVPVRDFVRRATHATSVDRRALHRSEVLLTIGHALAQRRKVHVAYASASSGGASSERVIQPYALLPYGRSWHVVAFCEARRDVRMFKADRIRSLAITEKAYAIPADFDLESFLGDGWGLLRMHGVPSEEVTLLFDATAGRWVSEEQWHPRQSVSTDADGRVHFHVKVPITPELVRWVLSYGRRVRVVAPLALREAVLSEARAMLDGSEHGPDPTRSDAVRASDDGDAGRE